jgi:pyruvate dehydrogenase E2 component (dihydrolipoamide acetyltransferase)
MATEVVMPQLGMTMTEGTIVRWLKNEGDQIEKGELLLEVETDKATMEVEARASGVLGRILVGSGVTLPVGQTIALIIQPGESLPPLPTPIISTSASGEEEAPSAQSSPLASATVDRETRPSIRASPLAKRVAREHRIELAKICGTGPHGRITEDDVLRALEAQTEVEDGFLELNRIRKLTAERMAQSFQTAPHFYLAVEADAGEILVLHRELTQAVEAQPNPRLSLTDLLVAAVALALREHPLANSAWADGKIRVNQGIHIGLAMATDDGLVVPVLHNADQKSLAELALMRDKLIQKAKAGKLSLDELTGGTFTVSNLGMYGMDFVHPIINPPQSGILGVGRIRDRVVPFQGQVAIRPTVHLTLSVDHRVLDGTTAASFLHRVSELIEDPKPLRLRADQRS